MVSVLGLECRRPGFQSRCGQRNLVMKLVNIYLVLSCSFVEIMHLCDAKPCIVYVCYVSLCEGLHAGVGSLSYIVDVDCCGLSMIVMKNVMLLLVLLC